MVYGIQKGVGGGGKYCEMDVQSYCNRVDIAGGGGGGGVFITIKGLGGGKKL